MIPLHPAAIALQDANFYINHHHDGVEEPFNNHQQSRGSQNGSISNESSGEVAGGLHDSATSRERVGEPQ